MGNLSLVKSLSHLKEERKYSDEIVLESLGLAFARGGLAEITGERSAGKTSLPLALLAKLTAAGEVCALVDSCGGFDPETALLAGVELGNLLWVRCGGDMEKSFMSADLLVQAKGFGAVWLNLNGLPQRQLRMVPKAYWFRYRNRIRETPTIFLVTAAESMTGSASQRSFAVERERAVWSGSGRYKLLREFHLACHARKGSGIRTRKDKASQADKSREQALGTAAASGDVPAGPLYLVPGQGGTERRIFFSRDSGTNEVNPSVVSDLPVPQLVPHGTRTGQMGQFFGGSTRLRIEFDYTDV